MELTIDDKKIEAREGERLLQAALRCGIEIPHFCYHPNLPNSANCRMCLVKVEGVGKLMPACNLSVADKMKVHTAVPEVQRARRMIMEFLMLNHPVDCGICDKAGECRLQDYEFAHGSPRSRSREPKLRKRKLHVLSERIQLDNERCILCSRCVRFTKEISGSHMLGIVERGGKSFIERTGASTADPYSDNVIGLCPTGALLSQDFFYKSRAWYLEPVRSVCTGCSRVCSLDVWRRKKEWQLKMLGGDKNQVYRITAHANPEINGPWICNKGFDLHKSMARERVLTPMLRGVPASVEQANERAKQLLAQARNPAALVSAHASNEELDAFAAAFGNRPGGLKVYTRQDHAPAPGEVVEDNLLIRADKNPNTTGVRERFGSATLDTGGSQEHDVFLVWGEWQDYARLGKAALIHLATFAGGREREAEVCIPLSTLFERSGTFSNFEGKRNRFEKVFEKPALVQHAHELFARLT